MEILDLRERGGVRDGEPQYSNQRLFMQFLAFGNATDPSALGAALQAASLPGVLYEDVNDTRGIGLLTWNADPNFFTDRVRPILAAAPFAALTPKLEYSMLGRTYAIGHEPNLQDWLIDKPIRAATDPAQPWAIWYPLRRKGEFAQLTPEEQGPILSEHGRIGHSFGMAGHAQDIRLACFGMDKNDNDFIIGLTGKDLFPLSACIQAMRKTRQTSRYIEAMGPFFVGKAIWQNALT
jgi:hypothetical protein